MIERPVALIVHQTGACPLLKSGERWVVSGHEIHFPANAGKSCGYGMCSVFLKLQDILRSFPPNAGLPDDFLMCDIPGCDAAFRMEFASVPSAVTVAAASAARMAAVRLAGGDAAPGMIPAPSAPAQTPSSSSQRGPKTAIILPSPSPAESGAVHVSGQSAAPASPGDTVITRVPVSAASPAATVRTPAIVEPVEPPPASAPMETPPVPAPTVIPVPAAGPVEPSFKEPSTVIIHSDTAAVAASEVVPASSAGAAANSNGDGRPAMPAAASAASPPPLAPIAPPGEPSAAVQAGITNILAPSAPASDPGKSYTRRVERGREAATAVLKTAGPFLSRLPKELAAELVIACQTGRFTRGDVILQQGVAGEHLYIVAEGSVEVVKRSGDSATVLVTLAVGDCFGEMSILTGEVTSAEVRSGDQSAVLSLEREKLEALLIKRPLLSREFSKLLAERLKASNVSLQSELSRGILGKLSMISLLDLVQTLQQSRRTGTLVLSASGEQAHLGFRNGALCTAVCGDVVSDDAFFKVVCWPDGDFCFESIEPPTDDAVKVKRDTMGLMMEGMRLMDEARAALAGQTAAPH